MRNSSKLLIAIPVLILCIALSTAVKSQQTIEANLEKVPPNPAASPKEEIEKTDLALYGLDGFPAPLKVNNNLVQRSYRGTSRFQNGK